MLPKAIYDATELIEQNHRNSKCIIRPQDHPTGIAIWSIIVLLSLVYVAVLVPLELAFTSGLAECSILAAEQSGSISPLLTTISLLNAVVDFIFWVDLVLGFFIVDRPRFASNSTN